MKNMFSSMRFRPLPVMFLFAITVLLSACSKFDDDNTNNIPAAALMSFNLAPDQSGIGIQLSGSNLLNAPLAYTNYSGSYQRIYVGNREVESFNVNSDSSLAKNGFTFDTDKYYSLFVTGDNGHYSNVVTRDNFDSLTRTPGKAYIRYINAIPDSTKPVVTIGDAATGIVSGPVGFNQISDFTIVNSGNLDIAVSNGGSINTNRNITIDEGKVYTVLLVGRPAATDSTQKVQIKFISNGNLSNNQ